MARRLDDRALGIFQGVVAKVHARSGTGKDSLMRDVHLAAALFCTVGVVGAVFAFSTITFLPFCLFLPQALAAAMRAKMSAVENDPTWYSRSIVNAHEAYRDGRTLRLIFLFSLALFVVMFTGLALTMAAGAFSARLDLWSRLLVIPALLAPVVTLCADLASKYVDACLPVLPGKDSARYGKVTPSAD